jgi:hypothetical protein
MSRRLGSAVTIGALVAFAVPASAGAMPSGHGCNCTTTTTEYTTTTTTPAVTTTTVGAVTTIASSTTRPRASTTTTLREQRVTTTTGAESTTTPPTMATSILLTTTTGPNHNLPFTGGDTFFPFLFGLSCLAAGALLLFRRHAGSWRASS